MHAVVPTWEISSSHHPRMLIEAPNWLMALGKALCTLGADQGLRRLTCERQRNGQIVVNDLIHHQRYTVRPVACVRVMPSRMTPA